MSSGPDQFDRIPDPVALLIFNRVSDIKTLLRIRSVSKRFNSLVPQTDSLLLRVDRVISSDATEFDGGAASVFLSLLRSLVKSIHCLINPDQTQTETESPALPDPTLMQNDPTRILRSFDHIKNLRIELPAGDLRLEKGTTIKWVARFGHTLKSCVIFAFRTTLSDPNPAPGPGPGLKMRVVWTISSLIAASARHYMVLDIINDKDHLSHLVVNDKDEEGAMIMDEHGLNEYKKSLDERVHGEEINGTRHDDDDDDSGHVDDDGVWWRSNRTRVPAVRMRMRHEGRMELGNGMVVKMATLVVVRPVEGGVEQRSEVEEHSSDVELAMKAFGDGVYGEAVQRLLKNRSYILEMNSF